MFDIKTFLPFIKKITISFFVFVLCSFMVINASAQGGPIDISPYYQVDGSTVIYSPPLNWQALIRYGVDGDTTGDNIMDLVQQNYNSYNGNIRVSTDESTWSGGLQIDCWLLGGTPFYDSSTYQYNVHPDYIVVGDLYEYSQVSIDFSFVFDYSTINAIDATANVRFTVVYVTEYGSDLRRVSTEYVADLNLTSQNIVDTFIIPADAYGLYFVFETDFYSTNDPHLTNVYFPSLDFSYDIESVIPDSDTDKIIGAINGSQEQIDQSEQLSNELIDKSGELEDLTSELNSVIKPNADDVMDYTNIFNFIDKDSYDSISSQYGSFIDNPLVISMLSIVAAMGLAGYLLFGKK